MAIVMGLDQHRAQITAEWIDTDTGEIGRARISPALRADVRKFLKRFCGQRLEVALEATTGWRFVAEELRAAGAEVHLAEPAETAARRGNKKRAKTDRGDARHLRELLMIGRLPESWVAPDHLLDLRAQVRLRHTLVDQRGEWQQRIQPSSTTTAPATHGLLTARIAPGLRLSSCRPRSRAGHRRADDDRCARCAVGADHPAAAPLARRQTGCKALMKHYGIGELTAVAILAELGDARRFSSSRHAVRYAGLDITVHQSDQRRAPGHLSRQGRQRCAGRCSKPPRPPADRAHQTAPTTTRPPTASAATAPASHWPANCSRRASTRCASSATTHCCPPDQSRCAPSPPSPRCTAASSPHAAAATHGWTASKDRAAATRPTRRPHHPSCRRPTTGRGPR